MENIKIEPLKESDYVCHEEGCNYIFKIGDLKTQIEDHISEKHKPVNFEKERRNFVDKIWCSHE